MGMRTVWLVLSIVMAMTASVDGAPRPVPSSPYLGIVYRYADAMLAHGRDTYGPQKTGLLLSAMDRVKLTPLEERPIANVEHDQNLLRVLYTLSELSGKGAYREAADTELKWLLKVRMNGDLPPWQGFAWDVHKDFLGADPGRGPRRAWMLWDSAFALDPQNARRLAEGSANLVGVRSPREGGAQIRSLAAAYHHSKDAALLRAIEAIGERLLATRAQAGSPDWLSASIDCAGAARRVGEPLRTRLGALAAREDQAFCALGHRLKDKNGFAVTLQKADGAITSLWEARADVPTTAMVGMMCVSRYENSGDIRYRELIHAAADCYRNSLPPEDVDVWPMTFGHAISLELAAWRSTARQEYLDAARKLADLAVQRFWADHPLPRGSIKTGHYETATGVDTLALALVELHLSILHITAVRCPPNTIDR